MRRPPQRAVNFGALMSGGEFVLLVRARRGPCFAQVRGRSGAKLLLLSRKLPPRWPPKDGDRCRPMCAFTATELPDLYHQLLGRSSHTPLTTIWVGREIQTVFSLNAVRSIFRAISFGIVMH